MLIDGYSLINGRSATRMESLFRFLSGAVYVRYFLVKEPSPEVTDVFSAPLRYSHHSILAT